MNDARVIDSGDLRKYRTEIPNIIYSLGLTPFELALYNALKRTAGQSGTSRKSTPTLAKESGMSPGMVSKAKAGLAKPWPLLGNKPLIVIKKEKNKNGGKPKDVIEIVDIWRENMAFFSKEPQVHQDTVQVHSMNVTSSPDEIKKELSEEETLRKKDPRARGEGQEKPRRKGDETEIDLPYHGQEFLKALADFEAAQKELRVPIGPTRRAALYEKLGVWGEAVATYELKRAVESGWKGVFREKLNGNGAGKDEYRGPVQEDTQKKRIRESCQKCFGSNTVPGEPGSVCKHEGVMPI